MSFPNESQWEVLDYCDRCGCTLYGMGERVRWASEFCDGQSGHTLEKELDLYDVLLDLEEADNDF